MTTLDDFFTGPKDSLHLRVRDWQARLAEPNTSATLEVYRPEMDIGQSQAEMYVQFTKDGIGLPLEEVAWDDDLNAGLIRLGVRSVNTEKEAERFALGLRAAFQKASRQFGDGYVNSVLIELLQDILRAGENGTRRADSEPEAQARVWVDDREPSLALFEVAPFQGDGTGPKTASGAA